MSLEVERWIEKDGEKFLKEIGLKDGDFVLDFGCGEGWMGLIAARKGFKVTALDLQPIVWDYKHPNLNFVQGDIFKLNFAPNQFDLIINCSSIEHVGLERSLRCKRTSA